MITFNIVHLNGNFIWLNNDYMITYVEEEIKFLCLRSATNQSNSMYCFSLHFPGTFILISALWPPVNLRAWFSQHKQDGWGSQELPGEVCRRVPCCLRGKQSTTCDTSEPKSHDGWAAWRKSRSGPQAAGCQVWPKVTESAVTGSCNHICKRNMNTVLKYLFSKGLCIDKQWSNTCPFWTSEVYMIEKW